MAAESIVKNEFDFDGDYITKSPCRDCTLESHLPGCSKNCLTLSQVQVLLSRIRLCANKFSEDEEYSLLR